jgi:hypothetical protein
MSDAILEKLSKFVELKAQYETLVLEQYVVTDQVIASATTARLEAIDLELVRWADAYKHEIRALEGLCKGAPSTWQPGLASSDMAAVATT